MKSVVELEINAPRDQVARLLADPTNAVKWMDDVASYEPLSGDPGLPGSRYRLVPKHGEPVVATVVALDLPAYTRVEMDAPSVAVTVREELVRLEANRTRLVSEETVRFKSAGGKLRSLFAGWSMKRTHRRHMEAFKRFAEHEAAS